MSDSSTPSAPNFIPLIAGSLIFVGIAIALAYFIAGSSAKPEDPEAVNARIQPVAKVEIASTSTSTSASTPIASASAPIAPDAAVSAKPKDAEAVDTRPAAGVSIPAAAPVAGRSGEQLYKSVCMTCHSTGVAGAPKVGDKAAWAPRIGQGLNGLLASTTKGKNAMPPKGGAMDASETELARAIVYMTNPSGASFPEPK